MEGDRPPIVVAKEMLPPPGADAPGGATVVGRTKRKAPGARFHSIVMPPEPVRAVTRGPPPRTGPCSRPRRILPLTVTGWSLRTVPELLRASISNAASSGRSMRMLPEPVFRSHAPPGEPSTADRAASRCGREAPSRLPRCRWTRTRSGHRRHRRSRSAPCCPSRRRPSRPPRRPIRCVLPDPVVASTAPVTPPTRRLPEPGPRTRTRVFTGTTTS